MKKTLTLFVLIFVFGHSRGQNIFPTTGNVGIGTTVPQYNLEITSDLPYLRIRSAIYTSNPTVLTVKGGIIFNQENSDKTAAILEAVPPGYHVPGILFATKTAYDNPGPGYTDWYHRMYIHPNGNIGIGTTSPDTKLAVNGVIHSKEVKVDMSGWPDYVFVDGYKLPSLEDMEKHIKENGRLSDIPSTAEVETNGVNLGEMNSKLLRKIEELTLHLIAQNKAMQLQSSKIEKQQKAFKKQQQEINKLKEINHEK